MADQTADHATIEMFIGGLVLDPNTQAPIVILRDETGKSCLPIWIGIAEATSIATVLKKVNLARPMTHDLMCETFRQMGVSVQRAVITDLKDSTYFAELILSVGDRAMVLDARPSDALAVAIRTSAPILVARHVLESAKMSISMELPRQEFTSEESANAEQAAKESDPAVDEKDFKAIDKDKWSEILAELDPEDFKYKM